MIGLHEVPPLAGGRPGGPAPRPAADGGEPRRGRSLVPLLVGVAMLALVPTLLVAGFATWQAARAQASVAEARLGETTQALALAIDRESAGIAAALAALATSPAFGPGGAEPDLPALTQQAERVAERLGAAAEVRDFVEAEARIAESEGRLRALIELSPQMVWTADPTGRLTYASAAWWTVTGQRDHETLGNHAWLAALHPEDAARVVAAWEAAQRAAADAAGALALLDGGFRPDAVVTDCAMPGGMDGRGLMEEARRRLPRLPAVLLTGHAAEAASELLAAVERGGPFALVRKPAATEVLVERLERVLGERRAVALD
jgi:CheY-like chemotaxis protein